LNTITYRSARSAGSHALCAFSLLLLTAVSAEAVTAVWDRNNDGVTAGYVVYWDTQSRGGPDGAYAFRASVGNATSYQLNPTPGSTYYLVVRAHDAGGREGPPSAEVSFTPSIGRATLIAPSAHISSSSAGPVTATFTWNAVAGAGSYYLWVNDSSATPKITQWISPTAAGCPAGTGTCTFRPSTVITPGAGRWWIRTWTAAGGLGPWSAVLDFKVGLTSLAAATLVSPVGASSTSTPTYRWNAVPGATYYYIWVNDRTRAPKITQWFSAAAAGCPTGTGVCSATPSGTLAAGAVRWWVRPWNEWLGYGPWGAPMDFTR